MIIYFIFDYVYIILYMYINRFGEESQERMVKWLETNEMVSFQDPVLDMGCGNGAFLLELVLNFIFLFACLDIVLDSQVLFLRVWCFM